MLGRHGVTKDREGPTQQGSARRTPSQPLGWKFPRQADVLATMLPSAPTAPAVPSQAPIFVLGGGLCSPCAWGWGLIR